ncbi:Hypothetical protein PHPALM_20732 [Phytophthora palmivora]|uniref:Uncharacterized protein n=1 Tax=Phytophthora palmivora TaxID=4796 RepID=A0A2P4XE48_9STRA|nr:Hypothetical protein PHPALM_20732 [Phytophthora palmivora]
MAAPRIKIRSFNFRYYSKVAKRLNEVHFATSAKIFAEAGRKRSRQEELNRIIHTITKSDNCRRVTLLLETLRVVNNNLSFRIGEYEESALLSTHTRKYEFQTTV